MIIDIAVLSNNAALVDEFAHVLFVLADSLEEVFCFPDVGGGAIRAGNLVGDAMYISHHDDAMSITPDIM